MSHASFDPEAASNEWECGLEFRAHGHLAAARAAFERALAWYRSPAAEAWAAADSATSTDRRLDLEIGIGKLLYELGRADDAREVLEAARKRAPSDRTDRSALPGYLGLLAVDRGDRAEARRYRAILDQMVVTDIDTWTLLASAEISDRFGERDRAIERLRMIDAVDEGSRYVVLHRAFEMKSLRTDARFVALVRSKG